MYRPSCQSPLIWINLENDPPQFSPGGPQKFTCLFPGLTDLPAEIVYVSDNPSTEIPDLEHLRQYTRLHYGCVSFFRLQFDADCFFATWVNEHKHVLLITGSFGRSAFSYLATRSFSKKNSPGPQDPAVHRSQLNTASTIIMVPVQARSCFGRLAASPQGRMALPGPYMTLCSYSKGYPRINNKGLSVKIRAAVLNCVK